MYHLPTNYFDTCVEYLLADFDKTALIIMGLGVVQIIVHMVYFLQLNRRAEGSWTLTALIVTVLLVAILLVGALWVMPPLDGNAVPGS